MCNRLININSLDFYHANSAMHTKLLGDMLGHLVYIYRLIEGGASLDVINEQLGEQT